MGSSTSPVECLFCYEPTERAEAFCSIACREAWWQDGEFHRNPRQDPYWN